MEPELRQLLTELETTGREHDAHEPEHSKRMLNLEPDTAHLISILIRSSRRIRLLEIGTSNGYSTIWLAWSAQAADGHVISIDRNADKHTLAEQNLQRAGLRDRVELKLGDATEIIAALPGTFDLVFFDADRLSAPAQLKLLLPKLSPGALVLADNALSHPAEIAPYLDALTALPAFEHQIVPVGKGLSLAYKVR